MPARWMLYSYDALGLGHVRRLIRIARAVLRRRSDLVALLATCSPQIDALPVPEGLDYVKLPSARKIRNDCYVARTLRLDADRLQALRSGLLLSMVRSFEPDLMLVDKSPAGLMGELEPSLEHARALGSRVRLVLGWRDILDAPERVREEWRERGTLETLERHYDEIWVYGDPVVFDVREAYALPQRIAERVRYIGYLAPSHDPVRRERARAQLGVDGAPLAVVTVGGGEDGAPILRCYLEAAQRGYLPKGLRSLLVTGPFMARQARQRLAAAALPGMTVTDFVPGLDGTIAAADVVVGMAGYNTVCEVLGAGTPAVLVPRDGHREEQRIRAARLASLGVVEQITCDALGPAALAGAVARALARGPLRPKVPPLDGLTRVSDEIDRLLPPAGDGRNATATSELAPAADVLSEPLS